MTFRRPVILGIDAVGPLGTDLDTQWNRARQGESGIGSLTRFDPPPGFPVVVAGQVPETDVAGYDFLSPRQLAFWPSPIYKFSLLVVHRALERAGLVITPDIAPQVAVTFSAAVGGLDVVLAADRIMVREGKLPRPWVNPNSCINMVGGKVSILTGATGPTLSTITACATGSTSMVIGALFLASGMAKAVICGGVDFPLVEPIVAGFATMNGAIRYDPEAPNEPPARASRPFSVDRRGFVVSEGAAAIILADREFADAHGLDYRFELAGWAMTADANHYVAPNLTTVARAMDEAIRHAGLEPADIKAVNAHAASTRAGDQVEADALRLVFGNRIPPLAANKSQVGHMMGAASAFEIILALKSMEEGVLLPTINHTSDPAVGLDGRIFDQVQPLDHDIVLKNAFGFGGTNCCVVLRRVN